MNAHRPLSRDRQAWAGPSTPGRLLCPTASAQGPGLQVGPWLAEMTCDPHERPAVRLTVPPDVHGPLVLTRSQLARTVEQLAGVLWELNAAPLAPSQDYPKGEAA